MRHFTAFIGLFLVVSLCNAAIVQRRTYRNTEEILVPVAIIHDGEEIKAPVDLKENIKEAEIKNLEPAVIVENIAAAVDEEKKLEAIEGAIQADRRIDEAIVEEEVKEAVEEEQNKEIIQALEKENKLTEVPQIVSEIQFENIEAAKEPVKEVEQSDKLSDYKSVVADSQSSNLVELVEDSASESLNNVEQQPESSIRQATQATPAQTTPQQNFVQQFIQNPPWSQFFGNGSGPGPFPSFPSLPALPTFDPSQAIQSFQQFTSNLAGPFQNLGGQQQQDPAATTVRPAQGPLQQIWSSFSQQPSQAAPTQPGPIQSILNFFQGNRPQGATAASVEPQPSKQPEVVVQTPEETPAAAVAVETNNTPEQVSNALRDSGEAVDSFEESVQPNELIVVNDDTSATENDQVPVFAYTSN